MKRRIGMLLVVGMLAALAGPALASEGSEQQSAPASGSTAEARGFHWVDQTVTGTTNGHQSFTGKFTLNKLVTRSYKVFANGRLTGTLKDGRAVDQQVSIPVNWNKTLASGSTTASTAQSGESSAALVHCDILHLVLGPLDLDLLGLQVHLNRVVLDVDAVPGAGNLLGNLLCAVAGLLDGFHLPIVLQNLIDAINGILGSL